MNKTFKTAIIYLLALLLPVGMNLLFLWVNGLIVDQTASEALPAALPQTFSVIIAMNTDLAKFLMGLSTVIIGGAGYYLRAKNDDYPSLSHYTITALGGTFIASVLSIFFGFLITAKMRNQLANNVFRSHSIELNWPIDAQFALFVASLVWFGLLVFERELSRRRQHSPEQPATLLATISVSWMRPESSIGETPAIPDNQAPNNGG